MSSSISIGSSSGSLRELILEWFELNQLDRGKREFFVAEELLERKSASKGNRLNVLITHRDQELWIGAAMAAIASDQSVWFGNPYWGSGEWESVNGILPRDVVFGDEAFSIGDIAPSPTLNAESGIHIPTGGSSGRIKFAWHQPETLNAAVESVSGFFLKELELKKGSFCYWLNLPLWHVSGWMQVWRALLTHSFIELEQGIDGLIRLSEKVRVESGKIWGSFVPTQIVKLINDGGRELLEVYDRIIIGGASPETLLKLDLGEAANRMWVTYGMTETAGMVAAAAVGTSEQMKPLPGVKIEIARNEESGVDEVLLNTSSLCLGYNQSKFATGELFRTGDEGLLNDGRLEIKGRIGRIINTGGEKVDPLEVESKLRCLESVDSCWVGGIEDDFWGQKLVALVVPKEGMTTSETELKNLLRGKILDYKIPKSIRVVERIPYDGKGKLNKVSVDSFFA